MWPPRGVIMCRRIARSMDNGPPPSIESRRKSFAHSALQDRAGQLVTMQLDNLTVEPALSGRHWRDPDMPRPFETKSGLHPVSGM
jgi:hypothetical protein